MTKQNDPELLKASWDSLIAELQFARDAIDNPKFFPPEASSRNLAEGYRYLAGFIHHGIERSFHEDPNFPQFRNALSVINKSTIENPDAIYFYAPIDGRQAYLVKAKLEDTAHWRGEAKKNAQPTAPQYLIFDCFSGPMSGDTGSLAELASGVRKGFGTLDSSKLVVSEQGELELLLAPEKPEGYQGNYICTRKPPSQKDPSGGDRYANYVSGRQLFYDWEFEEPINLTITALNNIGSHPEPLTAERAAASLQAMGKIIRGQMHFWLHFYDQVLNCKGSHGNPEDGRYFFPINGYNKPNAASADTGGGMGSNVYAGGIFKLAEGEALYVEASYTGQPIYISAHLGNLWGESPDYVNHQSSLNLQQMYMPEDGTQRWIISAQDPGVQNWLDTTGLEEGYISHRWAYSEIPSQEDWPVISAKVININDIDEYIPQDMPRLSPEQRSTAIAIRQRHIQKRYRAF